jgi:hypothetical protein
MYKPFNQRLTIFESKMGDSDYTQHEDTKFTCNSCSSICSLETSSGVDNFTECIICSFYYCKKCTKTVMKRVRTSANLKKCDNMVCIEGRNLQFRPQYVDDETLAKSECKCHPKIAEWRKSLRVLANYNDKNDYVCETCPNWEDRFCVPYDYFIDFLIENTSFVDKAEANKFARIQRIRDVLVEDAEKIAKNDAKKRLKLEDPFCDVSSSDEDE